MSVSLRSLIASVTDDTVKKLTVFPSQKDDKQTPNAALIDVVTQARTNFASLILLATLPPDLAPIHLLVDEADAAIAAAPDSLFVRSSPLFQCLDYDRMMECYFDYRQF